MATAKKSTKPHGNSRAAKMRKYFTTHPTTTVAAVAKEFKTTYQIAYMVKKKMEPKKLTLQLAEVEVANKLGIPTAEYARQKAKILKERRHPVTGKILMQGVPIKEAITMTEPKADPVNHPAHYKVGGIETIDFIEAKSLGYNLGNVVKYVTRSDHKDNRLQDLEKARWYLDREIGNLSEKLATQNI
jgi:hypothetical protein